MDEVSALTDLAHAIETQRRIDSFIDEYGDKVVGDTKLRVSWQVASSCVGYEETSAMMSQRLHDHLHTIFREVKAQVAVKVLAARDTLAAAQSEVSA